MGFVAICTVIDVTTTSYRSTIHDVVERTPLAGQQMVSVLSEIIITVPMNHLGQRTHARADTRLLSWSAALASNVWVR